MGKISVVELKPDTAHLLDRVAPDVFDNAIDADQLAAFLDTPNHRMFLAVDDGLVVGMGSAVIMRHPDKPPQLFINEVGVDTDWRRLGVGRRITQALLDLGKAQGCDEAWLGTEEDNIPARALYRCLDPVDEDRFVLYTYELT